MCTSTQEEKQRGDIWIVEILVHCTLHIGSLRGAELGQERGNHNDQPVVIPSSTDIDDLSRPPTSHPDTQGTQGTPLA